jgi:hypothetical protein
VTETSSLKIRAVGRQSQVIHIWQERRGRTSKDVDEIMKVNDNWEGDCESVHAWNEI